MFGLSVNIKKSYKEWRWRKTLYGLIVLEVVKSPFGLKKVRITCSDYPKKNVFA
jgi:hypothetical protein